MGCKSRGGDAKDIRAAGMRTLECISLQDGLGDVMTMGFESHRGWICSYRTVYEVQVPLPYWDC